MDVLVRFALSIRGTQPRKGLGFSLASSFLLLVGMVYASCSASGQAVSHKQLEDWRGQIISTLAIPSPLPPLSPKTYGTFSPASGVIAERVTYGTEYGMRIPAVLYMPEHAGPHLPGLVVVSGHGGDKYSWYSFYTGILYARAGAVVLTYDPIGEGERNSERKSGTRAHDRVVDTPEYPQHLSGLMITDVMQGVSYLQQRSEVDRKRIAVMGYSLGSFVTALAGAVDPRIHAIVLSGGGDLDGPGGYWDSSSKRMCQAVPWKSLSVLGDRPAVVYALHEERGPTLIINGSADTLVDIPNHLEPYFADLRKRVITLTGTSTNIFDTYFIPNVSHRPNWVTRPAALWLRQKLFLPKWTAKQIEAMPETHIGEWAKQNDVTMDKGYIQEDREGGVMALSTGIPNVPRSMLNVLSDDQWRQEQDNLIYDSWVRRTVALLSNQGSGAGDQH